MKKGILIAFVFCFQIFNGFGFADSSTTYTASSVRFVQLKDWKTDTFLFHNIDTGINAFQNFNPLSVQNIPFLYLGNLGSAYQPLFYTENYQFGFDEGRHAFDAYLTKVEDLKVYRTQSPYTRLYYIWNRRVEQLFSFCFSQNLNPRLNYTVNFKRLVSVGDFARQETDHLNYDAAVWYASKNRRYRLLTAFISNNITVFENGGIKNDSIFQISSQFSTEFEPVYLNNARNKFNQRDFYIKQSFAFGNFDTLKIDTNILKRVNTRHRIFHEFHYTKKDFRYDETPLDSGVYANIYIDSINTSDRLLVNKLLNRVGYEFFGRKKNSSNGLDRIALILRNQTINYQNLSIDTNFSQFALQSELDYTLSNKWTINATAGKVISGDYKGNFYVDTRMNFPFIGKNSTATLNLFVGTSTAAITSTIYRSNHFEWNNKFSKIQNRKISLEMNIVPLRVRSIITYRTVSNYVYYDSLMAPKQWKPSINIVSYSIIRNLSIGKFHLDNIFTIQNCSNADIIRQPLFHSYNSLYFQTFLFKKALLLRTGFDSRVYSKFIGYRYDPATMQFYQESSHKLGRYPIVDFFITAKVKRAVLMIKVDHANDQIFKKGDYWMSDYPIAGRAVKVGLSWNFYD